MISIMSGLILLAASAWQTPAWDFYYYANINALPSANNVISTSSGDFSKWSEYITGSAARTYLVTDPEFAKRVVRINTLSTDLGAAWICPCNIGDKNGDGIYPPVWQRVTGYTYEAKIKVNSIDSTAMGGSVFFEISESQGTDHCYLVFQTSADGKYYVSIMGSDLAGATEITPGWHAYRITVTNDGARLYIDGGTSPIQYLAVLASASHPYLVFGDTTGAQDSSFDLAYIAVYAGGAVPAPQPLNTYIRPTCDQAMPVNTLSPCQRLIERGHSLSADLNNDCTVDFTDFAHFARDWMRCIEPNNILCEHIEHVTIVDSEIHYVTEPNGYTPRPVPYPAGSQPPLAPLPSTIAVPWSWGTENLFTENSPGFVYQAPNQPWILHLAFSSRYMIETPEAIDFKMWYRVSNNGGLTFTPLRQLILCDPSYNADHPIDGIQRTEAGFVNRFNMTGMAPIIGASSGEIIVPFYYGPLDSNGVMYNPYGTTSFCYAGALIARWTPDGNDVVWSQSQTVIVDANNSTRGSYEPTIAELKRKGSFVMIIEASNEQRPSRPNYRWVSYSHDFCRTWSKPVPLTYSDGTIFYSAASSSTVLRSVKNGRLYWIGNITPSNPNGNHPQYPLIIGELDEMRGIIRDSVVTIDTKNAQYDSDSVFLSNVRTYQDTASGNILLVLPRTDYWWQGYTDTTCWYVLQVPEL